MAKVSRLEGIEFLESIQASASEMARHTRRIGCKQHWISLGPALNSLINRR
jgi:hypothetical protein